MKAHPTQLGSKKGEVGTEQLCEERGGVAQSMSSKAITVKATLRGIEIQRQGQARHDTARHSSSARLGTAKQGASETYLGMTPPRSMKMGWPKTNESSSWCMEPNCTAEGREPHAVRAKGCGAKIGLRYKALGAPS